MLASSANRLPLIWEGSHATDFEIGRNRGCGRNRRSNGDGCVRSRGAHRHLSPWKIRRAAGWGGRIRRAPAVHSTAPVDDGIPGDNAAEGGIPAPAMVPNIDGSLSPPRHTRRHIGLATAAQTHRHRRPTDHLLRQAKSGYASRQSTSRGVGVGRSAPVTNPAWRDRSSGSVSSAGHCYLCTTHSDDQAGRLKEARVLPG